MQESVSYAVSVATSHFYHCSQNGQASVALKFSLFLSGPDPQVVVYQVLIKWKKVCDTLATSRFQMLYKNNFYISNCGEKKLKLEFYGEKHSQNLVRRLFCF